MSTKRWGVVLSWMLVIAGCASTRIPEDRSGATSNINNAGNEDDGDDGAGGDGSEGDAFLATDTLPRDYEASEGAKALRMDFLDVVVLTPTSQDDPVGFGDIGQCVVSAGTETLDTIAQDTLALLVRLRVRSRAPSDYVTMDFELPSGAAISVECDTPDGGGTFAELQATLGPSVRLMPLR